MITPQDVSVYYDTEDTFGDGGSAGTPVFSWIGIIDDVMNSYGNSMLECRGIGGIDVNALAVGMKDPEITLKWIVQKKRSVATAFDPATFFAYAKSFPTGLALGYEATFGASHFSLWYKGMQMDSLEVEFTVDSFIKASSKFVGQDITSANAVIGAASRASNPLDLANSYSLPLTGFDAEVFVNAAGAGDSPIANLKRASFYIKNNLTRIPVVRTDYATLLKYILKSRRELGGELTVYVEDKTQIDYLLNATPLDIRIDLEKSGNTPYFDFTGAKIDMGNLTTRLNEIPCEISLPFTATGISVG